MKHRNDLRWAVIIKQMEKASPPQQLESCKKLTGYKAAYRIRMGQYRIGFYYESKTIELVRILHRKEIYWYFSLEQLNKRSAVGERIKLRNWKFSQR